MIGSVPLAPWAIVHRRHLDVDALRDADLPRGAALHPRLASTRRPKWTARSSWRQFWTITLPMVLPFLMLAVLFRGIENFKMFDMVNLLTSGGPGSTTEVASITLKREAFEKWRTGYSSAFAIILFVTVFGAREHLRQGPQPGEEPMSARITHAHSVVEPAPWSKRIAATMVIALRAGLDDAAACGSSSTGFKTPPDSISYPPKVMFEPSLEGYCNLFTTRTRQTPEYIATPAAGRRPGTTSIVRSRNMVIAGPSNYVPRFVNSLIIAFGSTFARRCCSASLAAYAFSRFKVPLKDDLLFFILSTRMMPPIAVAIPIYLMYRQLGLSDTRLGMILLYTAVNVSLAVWLLKGFIDEIPREYEEAAMIDGYTRLQAFFKVVLPQATHRHRRHRHLLPDLRLERVRLRGAAHLGRGADGAAVHPDHHRRGRPGLAGGRRRHHAVPDSDPGLHRPAAQAPAARHHLRSGAQMSAATTAGACDAPLGRRWLRRGPWEAVATALITAGVLMLMQPFSLSLYSYSFVTTLAGTALFVVVSQVPGVRRWPRSVSRTCARSSAISSR